MAVIQQFLSTVGDGTGVTEMATTPATYKIVPAAGVEYRLERMLIKIVDAAKFSGDQYFGVGAALTNGILVAVKDASGTITNYTPAPIKTSADWGLLAGPDVALTDVTAGEDMLIIRWTFAKGGGPIILSGDDGMWLEMQIQDTLAEATSHQATVQGVSRVIV